MYHMTVCTFLNNYFTVIAHLVESELMTSLIVIVIRLILVYPGQKEDSHKLNPLTEISGCGCGN